MDSVAMIHAQNAPFWEDFPRTSGESLLSRPRHSALYQERKPWSEESTGRCKQREAQRSSQQQALLLFLFFHLSNVCVNKKRSLMAHPAQANCVRLLGATSPTVLDSRQHIWLQNPRERNSCSLKTLMYKRLPASVLGWPSAQFLTKPPLTPSAKSPGPRSGPPERRGRGSCGPPPEAFAGATAARRCRPPGLW